MGKLQYELQFSPKTGKLTLDSNYYQWTIVKYLKILAMVKREQDYSLIYCCYRECLIDLYHVHCADLQAMLIRFHDIDAF